ncbi:hypothetical protein G3H63_10870 [Microbacterium resistens]|uniref:hypothetical protein n=1 Tax=Microbacterium resistens TaxID=156977 RepID=UPI001C5A19D1|nr:hypothetical protein [Microbacterium resistens]MBW1639568.1 hypothetical protein [Microbacterium resistens]
MTTATRLTDRAVAMERLREQPTITVYDTMAILGAGEVTVRRAIAEGDIDSMRVGKRIHVLSAPLKRKLGID